MQPATARRVGTAFLAAIDHPTLHLSRQQRQRPLASPDGAATGLETVEAPLALLSTQMAGASSPHCYCFVAHDLAGQQLVVAKLAPPAGLTGHLASLATRSTGSKTQPSRSCHWLHDPRRPCLSSRPSHHLRRHLRWRAARGWPLLRHHAEARPHRRAGVRLLPHQCEPQHPARLQELLRRRRAPFPCFHASLPGQAMHGDAGRRKRCCRSLSDGPCLRLHWLRAQPENVVLAHCCRCRRRRFQHEPQIAAPVHPQSCRARRPSG